jgi:hypothetical protein
MGIGVFPAIMDEGYGAVWFPLGIASDRSMLIAE